MTSLRLTFIPVSALLVALFLSTPPALAQPVTPSIYTGLGTGTNLGGFVGVGTEVRLGNHVSLNAAFGAIPDALNTENLRGASPVDFDIGVKVYPFRKWVYAGVNYGLIDAEMSTVQYAFGKSVLPSFEGPTEINSLHKIRGFTFSLGVRTPTWNHLYASTYVGVTSDADVNFLNVLGDDPDPDFFPRVGLMVGVEIW